MFILRRAIPVVALVLSASLAACSDSTGPDDVDAQQIAGSVNGLSDIFGTNAAFTSVQSLPFLFPPLASSAVRAAAAPLGVLQRLPTAGTRPSYSVRGLLGQRLPRMGLRSPGEIHVIFPQNALGKTYEWDAATDTYVAGNAVGAPANGIRIRLYVIDQNTGYPFEPVQQIGYVDLSDESTPQMDRLGVQIRLLSVVVADYDISVVETTQSSTLGGIGFLRSADGTRQANFDLSMADRVNGTQGLDYSVTGDDGTFVALVADGDDVNADLSFEVGRGDNSITLEASQTDVTISGQILFNGTQVATISGDVDDPVIAGANGYELTQAELAAIGEIFGVSLLFLLILTFGVFGPALAVLGL